MTALPSLQAGGPLAITIRVRLNRYVKIPLLTNRFRAKRGPCNRVQGLLPESQAQNLALGVLYLPYSWH